MKPLLIFFIFTYSLFSQELQTRTQAMMGTFITLTLPSTHIIKTFSHIKSLEKILSSYNSEALLYILNHKHKIKYNKVLVEALVLSKDYYKETNAYFDISIGSISKDLYHFGEENETIPSNKLLENALLNIEGLSWNEKSIYIDKNITIDLGGMGKGFIVDKVVQRLEEQNITRGIIALSGDIRCLDICDFELQSPYDERSFMRFKSKISNLSLSTSGTYRRYIKEEKNHHLLNPKTASQGKSFLSVSLFTQGNNAKIDAYATAISVMPKEEAYSFLKAHRELGYVLVESGGEVVLGNIDTLVEVL